MAVQHMDDPSIDREWKKGSAELLILSLLEAMPRHGYEIGKLIEQRSEGALRFHAASLYPLLYRLEKRGWIQGGWVEKSGQRRRIAPSKQSWSGRERRRPQVVRTRKVSCGYRRAHIDAGSDTLGVVPAGRNPAASTARTAARRAA